MTEREGRGRAQVRDPAVAIAMAKCWLSTWTRRMEAQGDYSLPRTDSFHPMECSFCEEPRDLLIQMLEEFQAWSEISTYDDERPLKLEIEAWETLHSMEQTTRVRRAQGYLEPPVKKDRDEQRSPW